MTHGITLIARQRIAEPRTVGGGLLCPCPYSSLRKIECEFDHAVLTLRGTVPSFYIKQMAQAIASLPDALRKPSWRLWRRVRRCRCKHEQQSAIMWTHCLL